MPQGRIDCCRPYLTFPLRDAVSSTDTFWTQCIRRLERRLSDKDINTWIRPLQPKIAGGRLLLMAPNRMVMERVRTDWLAEIQRAVKQSDDSDLQAEVVVGTAASLVEDGDTVPTAVDKPATAPQQTGRLDPRYTFETFIEGKSNTQARAAAQHAAESPGSYNPLFIYGDSGLGKTHLMHGVGNAILRDNPRARIAYIGAEQWVNQFTTAIRHGGTEEFKQRYRGADALLIDDIQFFAGKERNSGGIFPYFQCFS